ncbi:membrane-anchored group 1 glycosyltransferase [Oleiphilus messinensis]|uniref:Membrane-anchored group 1 glycosyltransferase n=1 Tax=Oleiphilus messinensis TaxID=141451 RepID=A0A1Y0I9V7_9GAMM|nr:TIGR04063 family PEP-CTERM/XrtA system glycosyltransferase [Oleiphilus messinensis]ARU56173.1 membrane-anchored group 1 glycosyltransferase [Oleiphilus messinensis]
MKVLHILDHSLPLHSGYTFRTRAIIREQHALGIETAHITSCKHNEAASGPLQDSEEADGLIFYRTVPGYLKGLPILNQLDVVQTLYRRLCAIIEIEKPDILHAHSPCLNGIAALWAAKKFKIPFVYEMRASWEDAAVSHGTCEENDLRYRLSRALETYVLKRCDQITTICEGLKRDIEVRGISNQKITVIPNAVDVDKFTPIREKDSKLVADLDLDGKYVVGFIGSFYEYEGLDILVRAVAVLKDDCPNLHVLLVGGGQAEKALRDLVSRLDITDRVTFTGRVDHKEVNRYYSVVDILAYPRLPIRLTDVVTPLKPLEAMAMGKISLASDVGGHIELIEDGVDGFLFKAGNVPALAEKLQALVTSSFPDCLIDNGLKKVTQDRNWAVSVARYVPVYGSLCRP